MLQDFQYNIGHKMNNSQYVDDYLEIQRQYNILKRNIFQFVYNNFEKKGEDYSYIDLSAVSPDDEFKNYENDLKKHIEQMLYNKNKLDENRITQYFKIRRIMIERKVTTLNEDNIETSANFTREFLKNLFNDLMLSKQEKGRITVEIVSGREEIDDVLWEFTYSDHDNKKDKNVKMNLNTFKRESK